jgi:tRNA1Val (adenine37-N6)-methyltransferase
MMVKKADPQKNRDESQDTFYHGRIIVCQKKEGYRFSVDAPILADFIRTEKTDRCLELGTGCGIISLLLSIKPFRHITALEIQESLADLAKRNVRSNHLEKRIRVIQGDFLDFRPSRKFDVVFSNPPYIKAQRGRMSAAAEKWVAKHEVKCDILGIMEKTAALLKKNGRAYFIFTAKRIPEFAQAAEQAGLGIHTKRLVYPRRETLPNFLLTQCILPPCRERILPPLFLFDEAGDYTPEAKEIFAGRTHVPSF